MGSLGVISLAAALAAFAPPAAAQVVAYSDRAAWFAALGGRSPQVIGFDDAALAAGASLGIAATRYQTVPGRPSLLVVTSPTSALGQPLIYRPSASAIAAGLAPVSGQNVLVLDPYDVSQRSNGRLQLEFSAAVRALGVTFIDVETAAGAAGCSVSTNPTVAQLPGPGGNGARQFLGLVAPPGQRLFFVNIDVASNDNTEPVFIDDLELLPTACSIADVASLGGTLASDGRLTPDDVVAFLGAFFARNVAADLVGPGGTLPRDNQYTADDVVAFLAAFFAGCQY